MENLKELPEVGFKFTYSRKPVVSSAEDLVNELKEVKCQICNVFTKEVDTKNLDGLKVCEDCFERGNELNGETENEESI